MFGFIPELNIIPVNHFGNHVTIQSTVVSEDRPEPKGDVKGKQVIRDISTGSQLPQEQITIFISSSQLNRRNPRAAIFVVACDQQEVAMRVIAVS